MSKRRRNIWRFDEVTPQDVQQIEAWLSGRLSVLYSTYVLRGPRGETDVISYDAFVCMYGSDPVYRATRRGMTPSEQIKAITGCPIPGDVGPNFAAALARSSRPIDEATGWRVASLASASYSIPVGMIGFGHLPDGTKSTALYMLTTASPIRLMRYLRNVALQPGQN